MNPGDYKFDENNRIEITTKDTTYNFNGNDYYLRNDTLIGKQSKKLDKITTINYDFAIPLDNIISVEVERMDSEETFFTVLAVLGGIFAVLVVVVAIHDLY